MKKLILLVLLLPIFCKAQNVIYLFGMNASGQPVINSIAIPAIVNSGSFADLLNATAIELIPTVHSTVTRAVNSSTFTVSTTKQAFVCYNVSISCTATIGGSASGSLALKYSLDAGSTWITIGTMSNTNTITLAIALNSVQIQQGQLCGFIPANALVEMVATTSGTTTITYITGQETY